jgi:hypothetical protein
MKLGRLEMKWRTPYSTRAKCVQDYFSSSYIEMGKERPEEKAWVILLAVQLERREK